MLERKDGTKQVQKAQAYELQKKKNPHIRHAFSEKAYISTDFQSSRYKA